MAKEKTFADEVRQWRNGRKLLQKEAAAFLGIPLDTYRSWEHSQGEPHESPSKGEIRAKMGAVK